MTRPLALSRTEGEGLIDLLEADAARDSAHPEDWRYELAAEIRELFGCATREREREYLRQQAEEAAKQQGKNS